MTEPDRLRELGSELPGDRPDDARREVVRSSLLVAADEMRRAPGRARWWIAGAAFACGAAAAIAAFAVWPRGAAVVESHLAKVDASPAAILEHTSTRTVTGSDEVVRVHAGRVRLDVGDVHRGDRVRVATADAEVEGVGTYEVVVAGDALAEVSVRSGTAAVRIADHQPVFLGAGQTWHASVITATVDLPGRNDRRPGDGSNAPASGSASMTDPSDDGSTSTSGDSRTADTRTADGRTDTRAADTRRADARAAARQPDARTADATSSAAAAAGVGTSTPDGRTDSRTADTRTPDRRTDARTADAQTHDSRTPAAVSSSTSGTRTSDARTPGASSSTSGSGAKETTTVPAARTPDARNDARTADVQAPAGTGDAHTAIDARITTGEPPSLATPGTRAKTPTEKHFQAGWALLRAGKPAEAATELGAAADAGSDELASDARYFQAVALLRAGSNALAERALVAFLDHAPRSIRRGRASVMLGRLLVTRGDRTSARAWFESALHDVDPAVAAAARVGLDAK